MNSEPYDTETPAPGRQVITACAFIHEHIEGKTKVFLPQRALTKKFLPGVYELPGGHINFGEDIVAGLKREIREEFAMEIEVSDPFYVFTYMNPIKGSHSIEVIYLARFKSPLTQLRLNPSDHSGFRWIAEDELRSLIDDHKQEDDEELKALQKGFSLCR